jgi:hypothetical protein
MDVPIFLLMYFNKHISEISHVYYTRMKDDLNERCRYPPWSETRNLRASTSVLLVWIETLLSIEWSVKLTKT